jgi:hypothetical protein
MPDHDQPHSHSPVGGSASEPDRVDVTTDFSNADPATSDSAPGFASPLPLNASRYQMLDEIAHGGMGIIWRATDMTLGREVAVKALLDKFAPDSSTAHRFAAEAHITAQLQHPAIPPVHDYGILPDGRPFLAMKRAELERVRLEGEQATAQARSAERRKRRRLALAAVAVLTVALVGGLSAVLAVQRRANADLADKNAELAGEQAKVEARNKELAEEKSKAQQSAVEADHERDIARRAQQAEQRIAAQANAERELAQRESYRSTIKLAESMLQADDNARFQVADILWGTQPKLRGWEWGYLMARCPLEEWSVRTDDSGLQAIAATADGHFLVTAGNSGLVTLWDPEARRQVWRVKTGRVHKLAVDPLHRFVGVGTADSSLPQYRILDLSTGKTVHQSVETGQADIAFSASGKEVYVLDDRVTLRCIATSTWKLRAQIAVVGLHLGQLEDSALRNNPLFVDRSGHHVGLFCQYGDDRISKFRFFDGRTLAATNRLDGFQESAANVRSPSTPVLHSGLGEVVFSLVSSVFRKTVDGHAALICDCPDYG